MLLMWKDREIMERGRKIGFEKGWKRSRSERYAEKYAEGYAEKYAEGYAEGYTKGFAEGLAEGMARTAKIIRLHVDGLTSDEIAARLCLDPHIVEYTIQKFTEAP